MSSDKTASLSVVPSLCAFLAHLATSAGRERLGGTRSASRKPAREREGERAPEKRTVVSECRIKNGGQHERLVEQLGDAVLVGFDTDDAVFSEGAGTCELHDSRKRQQSAFRRGINSVADGSARNAPSASRRIDCSRFLIRTGLKTLSCGWPKLSCQRTRTAKHSSALPLLPGRSPQTVHSIQRPRWSCCCP